MNFIIESTTSTEQGAVSEINVPSPDLLSKLDEMRCKLDQSQVILFDMIKLCYDNQIKSIVGLRDEF